MSIDQPYAVRFTRHAARDLDDMFRYITYELGAEKAAKKLMWEVETSVANLREFPFSSPPAKDDLLARKGYRALTVRKKYVVLYRVFEDRQQVIIHRIFYGKRDYTKLI
ncbi:MAG: type II toxin-antitoxin system RelE/ParE family toxin [Enterocloster bolteae]